MSTYLQKAAALIDDASSAATGSGSNAAVSDRKLSCARAYAALAAIDKGLLPAPVAEEIYKNFGGTS